jgi:MFS family permease
VWLIADVAQGKHLRFGDRRILGKGSAVRDVRLIVMARGLRQFGYSMVAVVLAVTLSRQGVSPIGIGVIVSVSMVGELLGTLLIGRRADTWGRKRTLVVLALLMAATGVVFGFVGWYPLLLIAAFFGTLGTSASETAPFLPIEQAMLGQVGEAHDSTRRFATYNLVAVMAAAVGALAAGLPDLLTNYGTSQDLSLALIFALYASAALLVVFLAARLSPAVEAPNVGQAVAARADANLGDAPTQRRRRDIWPSLPHSRRTVLRLSGLFSLDAFAGGLIAQTLMALYFHLRFDISLGLLAVLFFAANLLSALSFLAAPTLARRFGLLNTMVFTHLPSNILLLFVPLTPTFALAAALLLLRQCLSQLDVPTRQAYTMELVTLGERTAAASVTSIARSAGAAVSPALAGALLRGSLLALGAPFLIAGGLKAIYDLVLWALFRPVRLPQSEKRTKTAEDNTGIQALDSLRATSE